ncbi:MAG: CHAT domain-containing tetratricopeptide repeat protein [Burkholderiaceae bacterium]
MQDRTGDHRTGRVGSIVTNQNERTARLELEALAAGCPSIFVTGRFLEPTDGDTEVKGRAEQLAQAWLNLETAAGDAVRGRYDTALAKSEAAIRTRSALLGLNDPLTLLAETRISLFLVRAGRTREALAAAVQTRSRADAVLALRAVITVEQSYLRAMKSTGESGKALPLAQRLVVRASEQLGDDDRLTILTRQELGGIYRDLRRFDDAINLYTQVARALTAREGAANRSTIASLVDLAATMNEAGRSEEAAKRLESALASAREQFGADDELSQLALSNLMSSYDGMKEFERASTLADELLLIRKRVLGDRHLRTLFALRAVAYYKWKSGRDDEASALNRQLVDSYSEVYGPEHPETLWTIHNSVVYFQNGKRYVEALDLAKRVVNTVEQQQEWNNLAPETRQSNFARYANTYKIRAQLHAQLNQPEEAFATIELTKARTLLDATTTRLARAVAITDPAHRRTIESLENRLEALNTEFARARNDVVQGARIDLERNRIARELRVENDKLTSLYPRYAQLRGMRAVTSEQLRAALPPRTLFLNYSLEGVQVLVAAVSRENGLSVHFIGRRPFLLGNLWTLAELMADPNPDSRPLWKDTNGWYRLEKPSADVEVQRAAYLDLAAHISKTLIEPLADVIRGHDHIVVSADSALALIPVEALPFNGAPLLRTVNVTYAPSAAVFWLSQGRASSLQKHGKRIGLFAIGGVEYGSDSPQPSSDAFSLPKDERLDIAALGRRASRRNRPLTPLPGSLREIEQAATHMKSHGTRTVVGDGANKSTLESMNRSGELQQFRIVLISAHGVLDSENPSLSSIVLSPDPSGDRFVTAADWMTYRLASDLIIASACETALGGQVNGEGITGLPFAFQAAGSARSLLTLWRVDDMATARFIDAYFARLARGEPPAQALRAVKLQLMADSRLRSPFYWAPFVLYGAADSQ